jgi:hypothetical protein
MVGISAAAFSAIVNNRALSSFDTIYKIEELLNIG